MSHGFSTKAIHFAQEPDPHTRAVVGAISLSTTFSQVSPGVEGAYVYSRSGNPTRNTFEAVFAELEGGDKGFAFSSGLGATTTVLHGLEPGDHVVSSDDVYGGTNRLFQRVTAKSQHLTFSFVDMIDMANVEAAITPKTKLIWVETPTNPTLKIVDIRAIVEVAKKHNVPVLVDNTFMSPYNQRPLELGADIVMHSVTKYINGHCDVVMGVIATKNKEWEEKITFLQNAAGCVPSAFDCYLALRGMKTLALRMRQHNANAMEIATFLQSHPKVEKVLYPGLESHPQHAFAKKQQDGYGGMISFYIKGGLEEARRFLEKLHLFVLAESLGGVESLVESPALMTHTSVPPADREKLGISDSLIRLSVGVEDAADLIADLTAGFNAV